MPSRSITAHLAGKHVLVSGSTRGIGREIAAQLVAASAKVIIHGRDPSAVRHAAAEYARQEGQVGAVDGDISAPDEAARVITAAMRQAPRLDILICNAGASMRGAFSECAPELFTRMVANNLLATMYLIRAALPHITRPGGAILLVSTAAASYGFAHVIPYSAAKMGLTALQQGLAIELAPHIHVGRIMLDFVANDPNKVIYSPQNIPHTAARTARYTQQSAARAAIRAIITRKPVAYLGMRAHLIDIAARLFPRLLGYLLTKTNGRLHRVSEPK